MGRPKALLDWAGEPLVSAWCRRLAVFGRVVVVDGAVSLSDVVPPTTRIVNNRHWRDTGPWDSLLLGAACGHGPVLVTPVDVPVAAEADLLRLVEAGAPACLGYEGDPGHPILVDSHRLSGPCPAGGLAHLLQDAVLVESVEEAVLANMNTPADYARFSPAATS